MTWESAFPPCACAIAALIACVVGAPFISYWAVMLQTVLGKLYLISLFVTLEGRAKLAAVTELTHFPTLTNTTQRDVAWSDQPDESELSRQPDLPLTFMPYKTDVSNDATTEGYSIEPESVQAQA